MSSKKLEETLRKILGVEELPAWLSSQLAQQSEKK